MMTNESSNKSCESELFSHLLLGKPLNINPDLFDSISIQCPGNIQYCIITTKAFQVHKYDNKVSKILNFQTYML